MANIPYHPENPIHMMTATSCCGDDFLNMTGEDRRRTGIKYREMLEEDLLLAAKRLNQGNGSFSVRTEILNIHPRVQLKNFGEIIFMCMNCPVKSPDLNPTVSKT